MRKNKRTIFALLVFAVTMLFMTVTGFADGEEAAAVSSFVGTWWAIIPPVIAIVLALITKEVYSSLFIGILAGGLLATNFNVVNTLDTVMNNGFISAVSDTAGIFIFLVILGVLVALISKTGASAAFGKWAEKNVKTSTDPIDAICLFIPLTTFLRIIL